MATIAVGDIHGNLQALRDLLDQIQPEVSDGDTVVFLGDYIDRGLESSGCINELLQLRQRMGVEVVFLLGNHEDWLLRTLHDYSRHSWVLGMEAFETIRSYSADAERTLREAVSRAGMQLYMGDCALPYEVFFDQIPQDHIRFLEALTPCHRTADCVCVHGGVDPSVAHLEQQQRHALDLGNKRLPAPVLRRGHHCLRTPEQRFARCHRLATSHEHRADHRHRHNLTRGADRRQAAGPPGISECEVSCERICCLIPTAAVHDPTF